MSNKSARFVPSIRLEQYDIVNQKGDDMGQVQTLVMDMREGLIAFALVSFGGFLGIGDKWFAMPWEALKWHPVTMKFTLNMSEDILKNAPGMDKDTWLEEIEKWQKDQDLELLDRYYTSHGYESYMGIVQKRITKLGDHKPDARFEINKDIAGEFRFNLVATNGEIIAVSQGYNAKESALKGIESVKQNAADAVIEDKTV
ncbi:MAG: YegP family protein [Dehalococcoidales bacterium]|nr:YegP family protein [Dehalococcoidales bacterium]